MIFERIISSTSASPRAVRRTYPVKLFTRKVPTRIYICTYESKRFQFDHPKGRQNFPRFSTQTSDRIFDTNNILKNVDIINEIPLEDIRNFCFIAHVDHGKSSLASRVLEFSGISHIDSQNTSIGSYPDRNLTKENIELLDTLSVERERGITVKASAASMLYKHPSAVGKHGVLLLNMVDTPGHVDFGIEVTRSLAAVQGALILFDSAQGIQAQTFSVFEKAKRLSIKLIPVLTKIDLPNSKPIECAISISEVFGFDADSVLNTSARAQIGIEAVMESVCRDIPPPKRWSDADDDDILRVRIVDSWFEPIRGVICLVQILSGKLVESDRVVILDSSNKNHNVKKDHFSVQDVGLVTPKMVRTSILYTGNMGYAILGMRDPRQAKAGSYMVLHDSLRFSQIRLPSSSESPNNLKSVLYASVHPAQGQKFESLCDAVDRLALNDTGLEISISSGAGNSSDSGPFLGPGLKIGFQGMLHVEIFRQRLLDEFGIEAMVTPPRVCYKIELLGGAKTSTSRKLQQGEEIIVEDLSHWPPSSTRFRVYEPMVNVNILSPMHYAGNIMDLLKRRRAKCIQSKPLDESTWLLTARVPWGEVVTDFHNELKNISAGYASFDTNDANPEYEEANLIKVEIMLNGETVEPLAFVSHANDAQAQARIVCKKLQEVLPRRQFVTVIQAKSGSKIIASERIKAYRKDVLTKSGKVVGGGDQTRKKKLLEKQKKGKKRQQESGRVRLSQAAFNTVITRS